MGKADNLFDGSDAHLLDGQIVKLKKLIKKEREALRKASQNRADMGPEVSRARMTTANARYMRCAEYVDRLEGKLEELKEHHYLCVICKDWLPIIDGVCVHKNIVHPVDMVFEHKAEGVIQ